MREVLEDLPNVHQKPHEVEEDYCKCLNEAIFRCANVQSEAEKITLYGDGLSNTIPMVVARYR